MLFATDMFPKERFGLVTGSRCTPLVPLRDAKSGIFTLAQQLANEEFFQHYDEFNSWQTEHGKMAEQSAFEYYQKNINESIKKGEFIKHNDLVGGSPDAICGDFGIDFKCPTSLENWTSYLYNGISKKESDQCQLYMLITGLNKWKICAFLLETNFMAENGLTYPVAYSKRMISIDVYKDEQWVEKFDTNLKTLKLQKEKYLQILKEQIGQ